MDRRGEERKVSKWVLINGKFNPACLPACLSRIKMEEEEEISILWYIYGKLHQNSTRSNNAIIKTRNELDAPKLKFFHLLWFIFSVLNQNINLFIYTMNEMHLASRSALATGKGKPVRWGWGWGGGMVMVSLGCKFRKEVAWQGHEPCPIRLVCLISSSELARELAFQLHLRACQINAGVGLVGSRR